MDASATFPPAKRDRAGLLLEQCRADFEERPPAVARLEELIGPELARRLLYALTSR